MFYLKGVLGICTRLHEIESVLSESKLSSFRIMHFRPNQDQLRNMRYLAGN